MIILKEWYLECKTDGHYKFYRVTVERHGSAQYKVMSHYGSIGKKGVYQPKFEGCLENSAMQEALSLVESKKRKGYKEVQKKIQPQTSLTPVSTAAWQNRFGSLE